MSLSAIASSSTRALSVLVRREMAGARVLSQHVVFLHVPVLYPPRQTVRVTWHLANAVHAVVQGDTVWRASTQHAVHHGNRLTTWVTDSDVNDPLDTLTAVCVYVEQNIISTSTGV